MVDLNDYMFTIEMSVRDYEVDYQGIVNNANYLHYLEHTRHEFCRAAGFTFKAMHERRIDPVLAKVELEYRSPLRIGDDFLSCLKVSREGPKFVFYQDIFRMDGTPVLKGRVIIACLENGRLTRGEVLDSLLTFRQTPRN